MAEQTFRSPNFFEREIDLSAPAAGGPIGTPAGVIGTANEGPAFVPVTVSKFDGEFDRWFGSLDPRKPAPYAVNEFLKHRSALTFLRVLGAGANETDADITRTTQTGRVLNAGFRLDGLPAPGDSQGRHAGAVQFIAARHSVQANESFGMPMFTDNDSFAPGSANLIRGIVLTTSGSRVMVMDGAESAVGTFGPAGPDDHAAIDDGKFKLVISTSLGSSFGVVDGNAGVRILTASMDPSSADYFGKVLNSDPERFESEQHLLYADYPVDAEIARAVAVGVLSGSARTSTASGEAGLTFRQAFGAFDARYTCPRSSWFISQPFGSTEHDLFMFEALDDGEHANKLYKISITNLKASPDDSSPYGTFTVQIRAWNDTDANQVVLEQFPNCSLNPQSENYVAKVIGDRQVTFNFDTPVLAERRLVAFGKYPNTSQYVRIVPSEAVDRGLVPARSLPFGFRGHSVLKTNDDMLDAPGTAPRLAGLLGAGVDSSLTGSVVPPIPFRYKVTKGDVPVSALWSGQPGSTELTSPFLYWGVKFERNTNPLNSNVDPEKNALLSNLTKFVGIKQLDVIATGSGADSLCNNRFTLARVAFSNASISHLTSSVNDHMREAAYIRNARLDTTDYTINDPALGTRLTFATILAQGTAADFNRFSSFAKFTSFMGGGWDGVNILDRAARRMNDLATSFDAGGGAEAGYVSPGFTSNMAGVGQLNNAVASYRTAINIMTDPFVVNTNILALPGIRETFLTDHAGKRAREYGMALYVMDIPTYDEDSVRLYDDTRSRPDVDRTAASFSSRALDNNYCATYFPDVFVDDTKNRRRVKVPSSVAALGALAYNDRVTFPWFAPAGFNRAALDFVTNVAVRLNVADRDTLYDARINPIATFSKEGFVIYGQKTLQINKSALDRVNVRRLLLEVKRIIIGIARNIVFELPSVQLRTKFKADSDLQLAFIMGQQGIEQFKVVMDETNNTDEDEQANRLNGRIVIVPTRTAEFIAIDFIITSSGVQFV
jgi:hypothetical protein